MPKMKTHKGAKRRFHITAGGKVLRSKGLKSHLRRKKPARVKRLFMSKLPLDSKRLSRKIRHIIPK